MGIEVSMKKLEEEVGRLSPVQKILLGTDGSVTQMLEIITGSSVEIETRLQEVIAADADTAKRLEINEGEPINHRVVELRAAETGEVLIYATSDTPIRRLSPEFQQDLMRADIPIGKIMKTHRIEARREIVDARVLPADAGLAQVFGIYRKEPLLARQYHIIHHDHPLISIEEIFPYNRFLDERRVVVEAPSRLHLGLIDLHGGLSRVDGGIGITLDEPGIVLEARRSESVEIKGDCGDCEGVVRHAAEAVIAHMRLGGGAEITLRDWYPRHIGLGSGTQLALATARAVCEVFGRSPTARVLSSILGRGGTSGLGTAAFETGGFLIDGGHSFGWSGEKREFRPSSASAGVMPARVTVRHAFPQDWRILLAIPDVGSGASGREEVDIFSRYCPLPLEEVRALCHEVLVRMLPGLVEHDLDLFGASVNAIQSIAFKGVELGLQPPEIPALLDAMREAGAACAGMSSFGPTLYAIGDTGMQDVEHAAREMIGDERGGVTLLTSARNTGADVRTT